jgi:hypothetical protein
MKQAIRSLAPRLATLAAAVLLAPSLAALRAQEGPMGPPPLLLVYKEEVKPGHGAAHAATEAAWTRILTKGKSTDHYLGMTALTGPSEAWFLAGYATYADWEAKQAEIDKNPALKKEVERAAQADGDHLSGARSFLAAHRKDLSYGPPVEIGKMRYMRVRTFRVKQGMGKAFEEGVKAALAAYEKSKYPGSFAFYEVEAGMGSPTFVAFRPMRSLKEMDGLEVSGKAFQEALGEEGRKQMQKTFVETVNSVENQLFAFSPKLSFPGPGVTASDPGFWTVKAEKEGAK